MGYVVQAHSNRPADKPTRFTQVRWRSDDPWGAVWRCIYEVMHPFLTWPPEQKKERLVIVTFTVSFEPDAEDAAAELLPADPLDQHRKDEPHKERKPNHGKIPRD